MKSTFQRCSLQLLLVAGLIFPQGTVKAQQEKPDAQKSGASKAKADSGDTAAQINEALAKKNEELRAKAERGDARAQVELGVGCDLESSFGTTNRYAEALKWYRMAAEQGDAEGEFHLGGFFENGNGVARDISKAVELYKEAADQGFAPAQRSLGLMYQLGIGVPQSFVESTKWFRRAAARGDQLSELWTGEFYEKGQGVIEDKVEAYKWFLLAAAASPTNASVGVREKANSKIIDIEPELSASQQADGRRRAHAFNLNNQSPAPDVNSNSALAAESPRATGTAFFITDDGYLVSNYHVVKDAVKVRLLTGAGLLDATVVKVDAANDLALLKAVGKFAPLPVVASRTVKLGGTVATVGFPDIGLQGFAPKLAKGEIASLSGAADDPRYFQVSLPVQPGNSGGALVDAHGNVVGIVAAKLNAAAALDATGALPENVNYAVKSSLLLSFLESVPDVSGKVKDPNTKDAPFEDVVKSAQDAAVLVLVY